MTSPPEKKPQPIGPTEPPPDPPGVAPGEGDEDDRDPESDDDPPHPHAPQRGERRSLIPSPDLAVELIKDRHGGGEYGSMQSVAHRDWSIILA